MMEDPIKCTVARLIDAQKLDVVWMKPYEWKRDKWRLVTITDVGKKSFVAGFGERKFDKVTGVERGTRGWPERLMGQLDKDDFLMKENHSYKIGEAVRHVDVATLRKVADLIGYDYQTTEK